ncbi:hypothetical protein RSOLAG22IIIB_10910 [Rhizoctonia solani]|uniref:Uncharacterized protein n=1 Tax=Rhizoctonia solani TaxID=456999 RepID=A0A0K6G4V4_9AGAM|nr:hypothetical protein RSOLAG22IIIB_10910 [Rhizoctonia solani]
MFECRSLKVLRTISPPPWLMGDTYMVLENDFAPEEWHPITAPHLIPKFERVHFWHGVSDDPPHLVWRTDFTTNPYVLPAPGGPRYFKFPVKTAEGVFNTALNPIWHTVAPLIIELFEGNGIRYSSLKGVRFATYDDEMKKTLSPITLWIATQPGTTTPQQCRDISPAVLRILEDNGVKGVVIEWYEAAVKELASLMRIVDETDPTYTVRRPLTAAIGLPIAYKDAQGSLGFYFHVNKDRNGDPSDEVMGVTCKHVLKNTKTRYQYTSRDIGQASEQIRACGMQRFQQLLNDSGDLIGSNLDEIIRLAAEVVRLANAPEAERDERALGKKMHKLNEVKEHNAELEKWLKEITLNFSDMGRRNIGYSHWAPPISTDIDENNFTLDVGTFALYASKFKDVFRGNLVDLGNKWTTSELNAMFWPNPAGRSGAKFATNLLHRIMGVVEKEHMATPNDIDENGDASYTVGKNGNTTHLTIGRYNGLDAYICNELGRKSIEVCIYNWNKRLGPFSNYGDSGSLVWTREGKMLGMIHSGEPKGFFNHVTYATPAWWLIKQILFQYPYGDFGRTTW